MTGQMTYTDPFMGVQNCSYICPGFPWACNHYCPGYSPPGINLLTTPRQKTMFIEKTMRSTYGLSYGNETTKLTKTTAGTLSTFSHGPALPLLIQAIPYIVGAVVVAFFIVLVIWCLRDRIERPLGRLRHWFYELTLQRPTQEINQDPEYNQMEPEVHDSALPKGKK